MQILPAMLERSHKNASGQYFTWIALHQLSHQASCQIDKTTRNAHQGGIAPQKSAGHGQNGLDLDIAGGPVAHHA
jgi:hypothetical protein